MEEDGEGIAMILSKMEFKPKVWAKNSALVEDKATFVTLEDTGLGKEEEEKSMLIFFFLQNNGWLESEEPFKLSHS